MLSNPIGICVSDFKFQAVAGRFCFRWQSFPLAESSDQYFRKPIRRQWYMGARHGWD